MALGVEYRTTERNNGKPVYVKKVTYTTTDTLGSTSAVVITSIPHGVTGYTSFAIVRANGVIPNGGLLLPYLDSSGNGTVILQVNGGNINMRTCFTTWGSGTTFIFTLYYTKD